MKYAIISDIHGNLEALQAVLAEARRLEISDYICLGDIVGYGADPVAALELVRELNPRIVLGNHDAVTCDRADITSLQSNARRSALWTKEQLSRAERDYLASLPLTLPIDDDFMLVHSSLHSPEVWKYIFSSYEADLSFLELLSWIAFFGHTHRPVIYRQRGVKLETLVFDELVLEGEARYLINPGSVGQPRDGDPRAAFGVFDTEERTVRLVRVKYPVEKVQEKILAAGLPPALASRLTRGS